MKSRVISIFLFCFAGIICLPAFGQGIDSNALRITSFSTLESGDLVSMTCEGHSGHYYEAQVISNLWGGTWTAPTGGVFVSGQDMLVSLTNPVIAASAYYRLSARNLWGEVTNLRNALVAYRDYYGGFPTGLVGYDIWSPEDTCTGIQCLSNVVQMLAGNKVNGQNASNIVFLTLTMDMLDPAGNYVDPWRNPFKYMCDYSGDGTTHIEFSNNSWSTNLNVQAAVWSCGPNHSDVVAKAHDDIRSW